MNVRASNAFVFRLLEDARAILPEIEAIASWTIEFPHFFYRGIAAVVHCHLQISSAIATLKFITVSLLAVASFVWAAFDSPFCEGFGVAVAYRNVPKQIGRAHV